MSRGDHEEPGSAARKRLGSALRMLDAEVRLSSTLHAWRLWMLSFRGSRKVAVAPASTEGRALAASALERLSAAACRNRAQDQGRLVQSAWLLWARCWREAAERRLVRDMVHAAFEQSAGTRSLCARVAGRLADLLRVVAVWHAWVRAATWWASEDLLQLTSAKAGRLLALFDASCHGKALLGLAVWRWAWVARDARPLDARMQEEGKRQARLLSQRHASQCCDSRARCRELLRVDRCFRYWRFKHLLHYSSLQSARSAVALCSLVQADWWLHVVQLLLVRWRCLLPRVVREKPCRYMTPFVGDHASRHEAAPSTTPLLPPPQAPPSLRLVEKAAIASVPGAPGQPSSLTPVAASGGSCGGTGESHEEEDRHAACAGECLQSLVMTRSRSLRLACDLRGGVEGMLLRVGELHDGILMLLDQAAAPLGLSAVVDRMLRCCGEAGSLACAVEEMVREREALSSSLMEAVALSARQIQLHDSSQSMRLVLTQLLELGSEQRRLLEACQVLSRRVDGARSQLQSAVDAKQDLPPRALGSSAHTFDESLEMAFRLVRLAAAGTGGLKNDATMLIRYLESALPTVPGSPWVQHAAAQSREKPVLRNPRCLRLVWDGWLSFMHFHRLLQTMATDLSADGHPSSRIDLAQKTM